MRWRRLHRTPIRPANMSFYRGREMVELTVFDTPELSGRLRVSETGEVAAPVIGLFRIQRLAA